MDCGRSEKRYGYDATYLHEVLDLSTNGFRRFMRMQLAGGGWSGGAPRDAWLASGIAGALVEDCGPCVQIACDMAMEAGMTGAVIAGLLSGAPTDPDAQLGFDYARALLHGSDRLDALRETIAAKWGEEALVGLSLKAMSARNYPVLKRAMGHARTCQRVRIGTAEVAVDPLLKAA
jgi:hypothetical protein